MMNYNLQVMNPINHNIFQEPGYHPQVEAISPTPDDRTAERDDVSSFFMFMMMMRSFFMIMMMMRMMMVIIYDI